MNAFNYPENNITEGNYDQVLSQFNQTNPDIIQGLQLQTCDMQTFLSQVSRYIEYLTLEYRLFLSDLSELAEGQCFKYLVFSFRVWREQV